MNATLSCRAEPTLSRSQLAVHIGLFRQRTRSYPLHKLDFIMMDRERPDFSHRHADWCVGDLTGRVNEKELTLEWQTFCKTKLENPQ